MNDTRPPGAANPFRALPSVERVLADPRIATLTAEHGHLAVTDLARAVLDEYRAAITGSGTAPPADVADVVAERGHLLRPGLRRVVNATGVVVHTNLGRAPLSTATIEAMQQAAAGYSNLEYVVEAGERGSRFDHLEAPLRRVSGAEAGLAVNNNASALLLALAALCQGGEVIISRGQLVEIGGGFRIPDVMRQSGATLVEVGTTNRTRLADYASAVTERTAAILRVHTSNFRIVGFTEETPLPDLVALAHRHQLPLIDDLGSGALLDTARYGLHGEPRVQASVAAGADVVLFSGDKLLGGPQAGIAVGAARPIDAMRRHPLARATRMDKTSIAGLAATLRHYERGEAEAEVPVWRMIAAPLPDLRARAAAWVAAWHGAIESGAAASGAAPSTSGGSRAPAQVEDAQSVVGGGSLPGEGLPTALCAIGPFPETAGPDGTASGARALAEALRMQEQPIVARVERDRVLLDPRTVEPEADAAVAAALAGLAR